MTAPASPQPYDAAAALSDLEHRMPPGSTLIPLVARAKRPLTAGWADATAADLLEPGFRQLFQGEVGIGLLCGQASGGLCLVDLDLDPLVAQAEDAFPALAKAPRIHGARGAKWLVRLGSRTNGFSLRARGGAKIGEFLAERQQGVLAGIHPTTGLPYHWHRRGEIPVVDVDAIRETLATLTERKP